MHTGTFGRLPLSTPRQQLLWTRSNTPKGQRTTHLFTCSSIHVFIHTVQTHVPFVHSFIHSFAQLKLKLIAQPRERTARCDCTAQPPLVLIPIPVILHPHRISRKTFKKKQVYRINKESQVTSICTHSAVGISYREHAYHTMNRAGKVLPTRHYLGMFCNLMKWERLRLRLWFACRCLRPRLWFACRRVLRPPMLCNDTIQLAGLCTHADGSADVLNGRRTHANEVQPSPTHRMGIDMVQLYGTGGTAALLYTIVASIYVADRADSAVVRPHL